MISPELYTFISLDLPPLLATLGAVLTCALVGNFLLLRKISLMGDAISHAVLPGIVVGFLVSGTRAGPVMFIGAAIAGVMCAVLVELVRKLGRVESGAAMGVIFSIFFAAGVLMLEQASARNVDLDVDCVLHGQLELIFWSPPATWSELFTMETLSQIPAEVPASIIMLLIALVAVWIFYKELALSAFDPALSTALGFNSNLIHYAFMVLVAGAIVASFQIVGSILVVAMIICPAATARLLTDKLSTQILFSLLIAAISALGGYYLAAFGPMWFGSENSVSAAGMITVVSGFLLGAAIFLAPRYGIIARKLRNLFLSVRVGMEDVLGSLYRLEELGSEKSLSVDNSLKIAGDGFVGGVALRKLVSKNLVEKSGRNLSLLEAGRTKARSLVRSHRLWESYLQKYLGLDAAHVHPQAEALEHFTTEEMEQQLEERTGHPKKDPHGREIP